MASYSDYPEAVKNNARRVLKYVEENGWGSCGTDVGKQRANQLANGEAISVDTIKRMYSYLSRHEVDLESSTSYEDGCGKLMYDAWGGKAGLSWSRSKLRELGEIKENNDMSFLTKGLNLGFTDSDTKEGVVSGYFSMFGSKDLDGDIIESGAFAKTIQERGPKGKRLIKYLLDHDKTKVPGVITELEEDAKGLRYTMKAGTHMMGQDFIKMVESGIINQHSFGFRTIKEQYDDATKSNRIKEVMMYEGSAVQFLGANPETTFIEAKQLSDYLKSLEKFIRTSDASDECIKEIESLLKQLKPARTTSNEKADQKPIELKLSFESWKI
jgi:HK97 family phage prohead protease